MAQNLCQFFVVHTKGNTKSFWNAITYIASLVLVPIFTPICSSPLVVLHGPCGPCPIVEYCLNLLFPLYHSLHQSLMPCWLVKQGHSNNFNVKE